MRGDQLAASVHGDGAAGRATSRRATSLSPLGLRGRSLLVYLRGAVGFRITANGVGYAFQLSLNEGHRKWERALFD